MSQQVDFVLLIDDDESTNFFHKLMVEESAVTKNILVAQTGNEGIRLLKEALTNPDVNRGLVFIDINMPGMDGWMVVEEIEKLGPDLLSKISIQMVSASENPKDFERIKNTPSIKGHLPKPLSVDAIRKLGNLEM